jgi:hypothetical protein
MLQDLAGELENRLCADRASNFRGTALVRFSHLTFNKKPDERKVKRLKQNFRTEGCLRMEPLNRIKALIPEQDLNHAITASGVTTQELFKHPNGIPPSLTFSQDFRVLCLKGASRVEAAKGVLRPGEHDWAVELFLTGMSTCL